MNTYLFEQKIKTLSYLSVGLNNTIKGYPEMNIEDYIFTQWDFNYSLGLSGDAWLVSKEIEAENCIEAFNYFRNNLDKIIQKIGFISQCYMDFYKESFLFFKINNNPEKVFFYKKIQDRNPVGLEFSDNELSDYQKLLIFQFPEVFRFLQECRNTIGYIPRLMLLFAALEAMCDKRENISKDGSIYITYDKNKMKIILGHELFDEIFGINGVRHKLYHGEMVYFIFEKDYVGEVYKNILCYFNKKQGININIDVISPQRHFYDNFELSNLWLKADDDFEVNLKNCIKNFNTTSMARGCQNVYVDPNQY